MENLTDTVISENTDHLMGGVGEAAPLPTDGLDDEFTAAELELIARYDRVIENQKLLLSGELIVICDIEGAF